MDVSRRVVPQRFFCRPSVTHERCSVCFPSQPPSMRKVILITLQLLLLLPWWC